MDAAINNNLTIDDVFEKITSISNKPKPNYQESVNNFLDKLSEVRNHVDSLRAIAENTSELLTITSSFYNLNDFQLKKIESILEKSTYIKSTLFKHLIQLHKNKVSKNLPDCFKKFKDSIDVIDEQVEDLKDLFFEFPKDEEYNKLVRELS